jgi:hypothetical protein
MRDGRLSHRPGYTPKKPGEESGPAFSDKPRLGMESPHIVLMGACRTGEQVSTDTTRLGNGPSYRDGGMVREA